MIKEVSTCAYQMVIYTPRLCNDVAFQPPQENLAHPISCQPVLSEEEADDWKSSILQDKVRETERLLAEHENSNPLRTMDPGLEGSTKRGPIIGGIEVGAKALVGSEGKVIEKGIIAGGGKHTLLGTLAMSDGTRMSNAELKKLGLSSDSLDVLIKESKASAGDKEWKLDLYETPRGKHEFRLIEYFDSEEEKGEEKSGEKKQGKPKEGKKGKKEVEEPVGEAGGDSEEGSEEVYKDEL